LSFSAIRSVVEAELDGPLSENFAHFNREPIAAASIAQVHEARGHRNERLAVKVQRPGIAVIFETDMRILGGIAVIIDWTGWFPGIAARDVIEEFATYTRREMNFLMEGRTADRLRAHATPQEEVPKVYWDLTTRRVLTMEFIEGLSVAQASRLLKEQGIAAVRARVANFEPAKALHNFAFASMRQLFGTGFFHADPHPGNILLLDDNRIAFVDFGIFGALTDERRKVLSGYIENVAMGNIDASYLYYSKLARPSGKTDIESFQRETKAVLYKWYLDSLRSEAMLSERHVANVIGEITEILRKHNMRVDIDTLLFWRAAIALDSSALSLSTDFDLIKEMRFYFTHEQPSIATRLFRASIDPDRIAAKQSILVSASRVGQEVVGGLATNRYSLSIEVEESADRRRSENGHVGAILLVLSAVSAMSLALLMRNFVVAAVAAAALLSLQIFVALPHPSPRK
jgi:ubiquinone biosynthesis protein